jgi:ankyrin repeat protein
MNGLLANVSTKADLDNIITKYGLNYQDSEGESVLHELSRTGKLELVCYLFDRNRTERCNVNIKNNRGQTALYEALNEDICEFLLLQRIDYKSKDLQGKLAEDVNSYANFIINQKCNELKKRVLKAMKLGS